MTDETITKALEKFTEAGFEASVAKVAKVEKIMTVISVVHTAGTHNHSIVVGYEYDDYDDCDYPITETIQVEVSEEQAQFGAYILHNEDTSRLEVSTMEKLLKDGYHTQTPQGSSAKVFSTKAPQLIAINTDGQVVEYNEESDEILPVEDGVTSYAWVTQNGDAVLNTSSNLVKVYEDIREVAGDFEHDPRAFFHAMAEGMLRRDDLSAENQRLQFLLLNATSDHAQANNLPATTTGEFLSPLCLEAAYESLDEYTSTLAGTEVSNLPKISNSMSPETVGKAIYETAKQIYTSVTQTPFDEIVFAKDTHGGLSDVREYFDYIVKNGQSRDIPESTMKIVGDIYGQTPNTGDRIKLDLADFADMTFFLVQDMAGPALYIFPRFPELVDEARYSAELAEVNERKNQRYADNMMREDDTSTFGWGGPTH